MISGCSELFRAHFKTNGIYTIDPFRKGDKFQVLCDLTGSSPRGGTIIQVCHVSVIDSAKLRL